MPAGKLRRAIGAVKDQTSIGLAKFSRRSSALEVAVLRATSHDEYPVDDRRYTEVLLLASSNPAATAEFVQTLTRRITRTHNWIVALKALSLTFIALRDFRSPNFAREALAASHRGGPRLLDLSGFTDDSGGSSPWDFTAFVRTFASTLKPVLNALSKESSATITVAANRPPQPPVLCKEIGVGRAFEYPAVGRISKILLETMEEFLKDEQQKKQQRQQQQQQQQPPPQSTPLKSLLSKQMNHFDGHTSDKSKLEYRWPSGNWRSNEGERSVDGWELVLVESASNMSKNSGTKNSENMMRSPSNNPFLE
ncbi:hypothetical protein J5N97_009393 [Dioscorea zingiberensis]|uniref:ENTH domain-containing protein n=1 Tax=Dioscorea zingiberensis TaxID=325984 RepID=A0A9D5HLS4_9LILI|nr:hypothetical protein J5N97_009393 [Dioscorea zingiberensis]